MLEYNILSDEWKETNTPMIQKRYDHSCLMIDQYELMVVGGSSGGYSGVYLNSSEIFNLKEKTWIRGPDLQEGIKGAQFVKAKSGFEYIGYVIGGRKDNGGNKVTDSSTIFGLTQDRKDFKEIGDLHKARSDHVAFVLPESISEKCGN